MTAFVLDSSVALCWCFENEATAETDELFRRARDEGAAVPNLWPVEVANVLVGAERSRRIDSTKLTEALLLLESIGLEIEADTSSRAFRELVQIAQVERLTTTTLLTWSWRAAEGFRSPPKTVILLRLPGATACRWS